MWNSRISTGMGRNLLSLQHFLHTPNLLQLPLKTTHHAAHSGMHIPYQSPRVFCALLECPYGALSLASPNLHHAHQANVMTCTSGSRSGTWWNPTGDDQVSSTHECGSRAKVVSSMTVLAHQFPPPSSSGC